MIFKECYRWTPDNMPETTDAVVVVSSCGTVVKRLAHRIWNKTNNGYSNRKVHVYVQSTDRGKQTRDSKEKIAHRGLYHHISANGKALSVHRLVAIAFIDNPDNLPQVNHKDGNRSNNHVDNLEWVTNSENQSHAVKLGLKADAPCKVKSSETQTMVYKRIYGISTKRLAKFYGMTHQAIDERTSKVMSKRELEIAKWSCFAIGRLNKWAKGDRGIRRLSKSLVLMKAGKKIATSSDIDELLREKARIVSDEKNSIHNEVRELCRASGITIKGDAHGWESSHEPS